MLHSEKLRALLLLAAVGGLLTEGCGSPGSERRGTGGAPGTGGASTGTGGANPSGGASAGGGTFGSGGATSSGGATGGGGSSGGSSSGGTPASGGASTDPGGRGGGGGSAAGGGRGGAGGASTGAGGALARFSFFVTSLEAMRRLSGSNDGFGGDLRFGEETGLAGADKICATIAESSMAGASAKGWRAFLSTYRNPGEVNAIDRIGEGPWYDRMGRVVSRNKSDLLQIRPRADAAIADDLPNEFGIQNHNPDGFGNVDNHDVMTGTGGDGKLLATARIVAERTCDDWTSAEAKPIPGSHSVSGHGPFCGHSWQGNWMAYIEEGGCGPGVNLIETGPARPGEYTVGSGGGYGAIYCFALQP